MKIAVDARHLSGRLTGIGRYVVEILNCMPQHLPHARWTLYARRSIDIELPAGDWRVVVESNPFFRRLPGALWAKYRLGRLMAKNAPDVVWAASTLAPSIAAPVVATVYDLNHLIVPETMAPVTRFAYLRWFARDVERASQVVAISNGTASRLKEVIGRAADGVALPGSKWAAMAVRGDSLPVPKPYILSVATREPRKNLNNLIEAMAHLKSRGELAGYSLVLAGAPGWGPELKALKAGKPEWLVELGYVPDEAMAGLLRNAEVLAQPSVYEGFGMPAAEAAALGTRVLATDIPELREAAGSAGVYVGTEAADISAGLMQVLAMPKPVPRPGNSWADAAAVVAQALRRAAETGTRR